MKLTRVLFVLGLCGLAGWVHDLQASESDSAARTQSTYYASGVVRTQAVFRDGLRDGPSLALYADGSKMAEGAYAKGRMSGPWTFWLPSGAIDEARTGVYRDGEKAE